MCSVIMREIRLKKFSYSFLIAHIIFIIFMSYVYFTGRKDAQHQLFWIIPGLVDLPISILAFFLALGDMKILAILLATLGSFQYFLIGLLIDFLLSKNRKELKPRKVFYYFIIILTIIITIWSYRNYKHINLSKYEKLQIALKDPSDRNRGFWLSKAANESFNLGKYDEARKYAEELLSIAENDKNNFSYGEAVYFSHMVLGRLALLNDGLDQARKHLLESAKTPGSPTLNSFGPNMSLAKDY